jgi:hypothetical protein
MRFIGNHPIPEHVNPPEEAIAPEEKREQQPQPEASAESPQNVRSIRQRRRKTTAKPGDRQAA